MYEYPFHIRKLNKDEGSGFLAEAIDLPGCVSDGETINEAADNLQDAIKCWIKTAEEFGNVISL